MSGCRDVLTERELRKETFPQKGSMGSEREKILLYRVSKQIELFRLQSILAYEKFSFGRLVINI
jgi:hypothetical protein